MQYLLPCRSSPVSAWIFRVEPCLLKKECPDVTATLSGCLKVYIVTLCVSLLQACLPRLRSNSKPLSHRVCKEFFAYVAVGFQSANAALAGTAN